MANRDQIISEITMAVSEAFKSSLNGQIKGVSEQIAKQDNKIFKLSEDIREIKEKIQPITSVYSNASGFWKTVLALAVFAGSISGLIFSFNAIVTFLHIR